MSASDNTDSSGAAESHTPCTCGCATKLRESEEALRWVRMLYFGALDELGRLQFKYLTLMRYSKPDLEARAKDPRFAKWEPIDGCASHPLIDPQPPTENPRATLDPNTHFPCWRCGKPAVIQPEETGATIMNGRSAVCECGASTLLRAVTYPAP